MDTLLKQWIDDGVIPSPYVDKALNMFKEEIGSLSTQRKYWDAYKELLTCIALLNTSAQQQPAQGAKIIRRLLNWIRQLKNTIDNIVRGIGANGYSIAVSYPWGISVSVSFPV